MGYSRWERPFTYTNINYERANQKGLFLNEYTSARCE